MACMETEVPELGKSTMVGLLKYVCHPAAAETVRRETQTPPAGSSTDAPSRPPTHRYIGTMRETSPNRTTSQPEAKRTKLVRFPYTVAGEHMNTVLPPPQRLL